MRRADRAGAVLRASNLSGGSRHGDRAANRLSCKGSKERRRRHRRPLCLRQRHGVNHERKLSGARHHARAGTDVRLHCRPAPCRARCGGERPTEGTRMKAAATGFAINTYSYIFGGSAADTVARLADQGYGGVELMFFPGHLWPAELDASALRTLRKLCEARLRLVAVNMPNVDMNVAAAAEEMRTYTLNLLVQFVRCAGELGAGGIIVGPGKANPLFPMPRDRMISYFYRALDTLAPLARQARAPLLDWNIPFSLPPGGGALLNGVEVF